jgi:PAS domain S-box-containing protein
VVLDANRTLAESLGLSSDELVGRQVSDLFPEGVLARRWPYHEQVLKLKRPVRFEDERDGTWFDNVVWPILNDNGDVQAVAVIARDITERKVAERVLGKASEDGEGTQG